MQLPCQSCGWPISHKRIQYYQETGLGNPTECVVCANNQPKVVAYMLPEGKTGAGYAVKTDDPEIARQLQREVRRAR